MSSGVATRRSRGVNAGVMNAYSCHRITGRANSSAKYAETITVCENGSPIPRVTGRTLADAAGAAAR